MNILDHNETSILLENTSIFSNKTSQMWLNIRHNQFMVGYQLWAAGELIQNAFPMLSADEREFIMTGCTPEEWDEMFS